MNNLDEWISSWLNQFKKTTEEKEVIKFEEKWTNQSLKKFMFHLKYRLDGLILRNSSKMQSF